MIAPAPYMRTPVQEFHRAVADEVADSMRPHGSVGGGYGGGAGTRVAGPGAGGFRDRGGYGAGERGANGAPGARALPPPLPQDPSINPRGIEAIAKLRGLPFEASPRDVMEWINAAYQKREVLLSAPVCTAPLPLSCLPVGPRAWPVRVAEWACRPSQTAVALALTHRLCRLWADDGLAQPVCRVLLGLMSHERHQDRVT